jgi:hypothetical protein
MKNSNVRNNCGKKRGCYVLVVLPHDSSIGIVLSGVHAAEHDIQKVLSFAHTDLDKKLA